MRPVTTPEMIAQAHIDLKRIAELEAAGLLTRISGFGELTPLERQQVAQGTYNKQ